MKTRMLILFFIILSALAWGPGGAACLFGW